MTGEPLTAERLADAIRRTRKMYAPDTPEKYPATEVRGFAVLDAEALLAELATLEEYVDHHVQQEAKLHSRVLQLEREIALAASSSPARPPKD